MKKIYATAFFLALFSYGNAQDNWTCGTAQGIDISLPYAENVDASASPDDGNRFGCGFTTKDGVWYTFTGNGKYITIEAKPMDSWNAVIQVFKGSCGALDCEDSADFYNGAGAEELTIATTDGTVYFINIGAGPTGSTAPRVGKFTLKVGIAALSNQSCSTAEAISIPVTKPVDASKSLHDGHISKCGNGMNDGVWYTFTGDGKYKTIAVTNVNWWDPEIGVYTGSCNNNGLTCVKSADLGGQTESETLSIPTVDGTVYYINIGSTESIYNYPEGKFTLDVRETPELPNQSCGSPTAIPNLPFKATVGHSTVREGGAMTCGDGMNDGVWYTFTGNGKEVIIDVTNNAWNAEIAVYTGSCGSFTCVGNENAADTNTPERLKIATTNGEKYFINIGNADVALPQPEGSFRLTVSNPPVNQSCGSATAIDKLPLTTTVGPSTLYEGGAMTCNDGMNDGVWYTFTGSGRVMTINVTDNAWNAEIAVYKGSCGLFDCVGSVNAANTNTPETLKIDTTNGEKYFINIGDADTALAKIRQEGSFTLQIDGTLGTQSFDDSAFQSHPNPVKDILNLSYNAKISNVSVFNLLGQEVLSKSVNANEAKIDMAHLSNGTYTVKVTAGNESKTIKVVKQ